MSKKIQTVVLKGPPGVGKTTIVRKICEELSGTNVLCRGFYTEEVRKEGRRIGFDVVALNGSRDILARESISGQRNLPKIGKYVVYIDKFEEIALPIISQQNTNHNSLLILDEIGKMELISTKFEATVNNLIDSTKLLVTVPLSAGQNVATVQRICSSNKSKVFTITKTNRSHIIDEVLSSVKEMIAK